MKRTDVTTVFPGAPDELIDKLMSLNGADINAAKAGLADLQVQLDAARKQIAELEQRPTADTLTTLQAELDTLRAAETLREMKEYVAQDTGVPAELLTAETEDGCRMQAKGILDFVNLSCYPVLRDGECMNPLPDLRPAREQFADWMADNQLFAFNPNRDKNGWIPLT